MSQPSLILRPATNDDAKQIFEWRNDPWIVAKGDRPHEVPWEDHVQWLQKVLDSNDHILLIIESLQKEPMGTFRLDREEKQTAEISIYLMPPFLGKGYGREALRRGCMHGFGHWPDIARIIARIRTDNDRSLHAFSNVGFKQIPSEERNLNIMELTRDSLEVK